MVRRWLNILALAVTVLMVVACGKETKATLSGRWNDTDSKLVAETMIKEMLSRPWLQEFTQTKGRQPVVIVGTILNRSHEHINVQTFVTDLEREVTNSQKATFVASKGQREEVREERHDQAIHALEETQNAPGQEIGADYMMKGQISTIQDESDGVKRFFIRSILNS